VWRCSTPHLSELPTLGWYAAIGHQAYEEQDVSTPLDALAFARTTIGATFGGLAQVPGLGWALGGLIVAGLVLAWSGRPLGQVRRVAAAPVALAAGAFVFALTTAFGRVGFPPGIERSTRYVHVVGALLLPVIAVAADAVMRRWRMSVPILLVALTASLVGNIRDFSNERLHSGKFLESYRRMMLTTMPRVPLADEVPRNLRPDRGLAPFVSVGWLRDGVEAGQIPPPDDVTPEERATAEARVVLHQLSSHHPVHCETVAGPVPTTLRRGSSVRLPGEGQLWVGYTDSTGATGLITFPGHSVPVVAYAGPLKVNVAPSPEGRPVQVCDVDGRPVIAPSGP